PAGSGTSTVFGDSGNSYLPTKTTDAEGDQVQMTYDANGHLATKVALQGGLNAPEQLTLTWVSGLLQNSALGKSPNQLNTGYQYDTRGNVKEIDPPAGGGLGVQTMTYDGLDRLKTATDGDGNVATYTYDNL